MASALFDTAEVARSEHVVGFITSILRPSTEYSISGQGSDVTILLSAPQLYACHPDEVANKAKSPIPHKPEGVEARRYCLHVDAALRAGRWGARVRTQAETTPAPATTSAAGDRNAEGFARWRLGHARHES